MRNIVKLISTFAAILFVTTSGKCWSQHAMWGTVNSYHAMTGIDYTANSVEVASSAGLSIGDTILMIQMQGATSDVSNSSSFGDIADYGDAGNYEFNRICDIAGNSLRLENAITKSFSPGLGAQVVGVPTYNGITVPADLTAPDWDGTTGGVLAVWSKSWLRFTNGASVMVDGAGFRGGAWEVISDGCGCNGLPPLDPQYPDYYYEGGTEFGALKGEGISVVTSGRESGKGHQSNGGGGGNDHNGGGGGGANYGAGGNGGSPCETRLCPFFETPYCRGLNPGIGAGDLSSMINSTENRVFLGGGGGAGDDNGGAGSGGGNGGGIVFLLADSISFSSLDIYARGEAAGVTAGDGAGGGGAGGTVVLAARAFEAGSPLTIHVNGGDGGNSSWSVATAPHNSKGKGGGGGGGAVWFTANSLPNSVVVHSDGGAQGTELAASCLGHSGGTEAGGNGAVLLGASIPTYLNVSGCLILPVELAYFSGEQQGDKVLLSWGTAEEANLSHFLVQRVDGSGDFQNLAAVASRHLAGTDYEFIDEYPLPGLNRYRIKHVDLNGEFSLSETVSIQMDESEEAIARLYPNPVLEGASFFVEVGAGSGQAAEVLVFNSLGGLVYEADFSMSSQRRVHEVSTQGWPVGVYFVKVKTSHQQEKVERLIISGQVF